MASLWFGRHSATKILASGLSKAASLFAAELLPFGTVENITNIVLKRYPYLFSVGYDEANSGERYYTLRPRVDLKPPAAVSCFESLEAVVERVMAAASVHHSATEHCNAQLRLSELQNAMFEAVPKNSLFAWDLKQVLSGLPPHVSSRYLKQVMPMGVQYPDAVVALFQAEEFAAKCSALKRLPKERLLFRERILSDVYTYNGGKVPVTRVATNIGAKYDSVIKCIANNCSTDLQLSIRNGKEFVVTPFQPAYASPFDSSSATDKQPKDALQRRQTAVAHQIDKIRGEAVEAAILRMRLDGVQIPLHQFQSRLFALTGGRLLPSEDLLATLCSFGGFSVAGMYRVDSADFQMLKPLPFGNDVCKAIAETLVANYRGIAAPLDAVFLNHVQQNYRRLAAGGSEATAQMRKVLSTQQITRCLLDDMWLDVVVKHTDEGSSVSMRTLATKPAAEMDDYLARLKAVGTLIKAKPDNVLQMSAVSALELVPAKKFRGKVPSSMSDLLTHTHKYYVLPLQNGDSFVCSNWQKWALCRALVRLTLDTCPFPIHVSDLGKVFSDRLIWAKYFETTVSTLISGETVGTSVVEKATEKKVKPRKDKLPFELTSNLLMERCSDLVHIPQGSAQVFQRKPTRFASHIQAALAGSSGNSGEGEALRLSELKQVLEETHGELYANVSEEHLVKSLSTMPFVRLQMVKVPQITAADTSRMIADESTTAVQQTLGEQLQEDSSAVVLVESSEVLSEDSYEWSVSLAISPLQIVNSADTITDEIVHSVCHSMAAESAERQTATVTESAKDSTTRGSRNAAGGSLTIAKVVSNLLRKFPLEFEERTGVIWNPNGPSLTQYLRGRCEPIFKSMFGPPTAERTAKSKRGLVQPATGSTLPISEMNSNLSTFLPKRVFSERYLGCRLSELCEVYSAESVGGGKFWQLKRCLECDCKVSLTRVPYGPVDFFVFHSEFPLMSDSELKQKLLQCFTEISGSDPFNQMVTERTLRDVWQRAVGSRFPLSHTLDVQHAFAFHLADAITVHIEDNGAVMYSLNASLAHENLLLSSSSLTRESTAAMPKSISGSVQSKEVPLHKRVFAVSPREMRDIITQKTRTYKTGEELLLDLFHSQKASSLAGLDPTTMAHVASQSKDAPVFVRFSQMAASLCAPLKLPLVKDWLSFLLERFDGHICLVPERHADLLFSIQNVEMLQEKARFLKSVRQNRFLHYSPYERELLYAEIIKRNGSATLGDLRQTLSRPFGWYQYGEMLHNHLCRTYSMDFKFGRNTLDSQKTESTLPKKTKATEKTVRSEPMSVVTSIGLRTKTQTSLPSSMAASKNLEAARSKRKKAEERWDDYYNSFSVSLLKAQPTHSFNALHQPMTTCLAEMCGERRTVYIDEIQPRFLSQFGALLPSTNLQATLLRYGAIVLAPEKGSGHYQECQIVVAESGKSQTVSVVFDALNSLLSAKLKANTARREAMRGSSVWQWPSASKELDDAYDDGDWNVDQIEAEARYEGIENEFGQFDTEAVADSYLSLDALDAHLCTTQHIYLQKSPLLVNELLKYLIHNRSQDYVCTLDWSQSRTLQLKWKVKQRSIIATTNGGKVRFQDIVRTLQNQRDLRAGMRLSQLQSHLYKHCRKMIAPMHSEKLSLLKAVESLCVEARASGVPLRVRQCGPDAIVYLSRTALYREAVRYILAYHPMGLTTNGLRDTVARLIGKRKQQVYDEIPNLYKFLFDNCFGIVQSARSRHTNLFQIAPFHIENFDSFQLRRVVFELTERLRFEECLKNASQQFLDDGSGLATRSPLAVGSSASEPQPSRGVPLGAVKAELEKREVWTYETHLRILCAPFFEVTKDEKGTVWIALLEREEIERQKQSILQDISCEHVLNCNTQNLQNLYAKATGCVLELTPASLWKEASAMTSGMAASGQHSADGSRAKTHSAPQSSAQTVDAQSDDAFDDEYADSGVPSLRQVLLSSQLYLHYNTETRENVILHKTALIRLKKPWMNRKRIIDLTRALSKLSKRYRLRYADFVDEFMVEVPSFLARSQFFLHMSGLSTILSASDLRRFETGSPKAKGSVFRRMPSLREDDAEDCDEGTEDLEGGSEVADDLHVRAYEYSKAGALNFDGVVEGSYFSIAMGISAAQLTQLIFLRGTVRSFLRAQRRPTIYLSELQRLYAAHCQSNRWWNDDIPLSLKKLGCNLVADGKGDVVVDLSHLTRSQPFENRNRDKVQVSYV